MKNEQQNKPYTNQVAETHIDSIINERYKRVRKEWIEGAHNVLQIRGKDPLNWGKGLAVTSPFA